MLTLKYNRFPAGAPRRTIMVSPGTVALTTCPNDRNETRLGITASKSVGGAVARNRAKHRLP